MSKKHFSANIKLKFSVGFEADSKDDFINKLKHSFSEDYNIELGDSEVTDIQVLDSLSDEAIAQQKIRELKYNMRKEMKKKGN